jgi:hypothetical protein
MGPAPRRSSIFGLLLIPLLSLGCVTLGYLLVPHYRTPNPRTTSATRDARFPPVAVNDSEAFATENSEAKATNDSRAIALGGCTATAHNGEEEICP